MQQRLLTVQKLTSNGLACNKLYTICLLFYIVNESRIGININKSNKPINSVSNCLLNYKNNPGWIFGGGNRSELRHEIWQVYLVERPMASMLGSRNHA